MMPILRARLSRLRPYAHEWAAVFLLTAVPLILVAPWGEYAVLDDWAYARSLQQLTDEGRWRILEWNPMSLVGQLAWGALFTVPAGFSLQAARWSVIVLSFVEALLFWGMLRHLGTGPRMAAAALAALVLHPLHLLHAHTFMTDLPALTWQIAATWGMAAALVSPQHRTAWCLLAGCAGGYGFLIRQGGLFPVAAGAAALIFLMRERPRLVDLGALLLPAAAAVIGFQQWMSRVHGPTAAYRAAMDQVLDFVTAPPAEALPRLAGLIALTVGFLVWPMPAAAAAAWLPGGRGRANASHLKRAAAVLAVLAWWYFAVHRAGWRFPFLRNVITPWGYLHLNEWVIGSRPRVWGSLGSALMTAACLAGCTAVACLLCGTRSNPEGAAPDAARSESRRRVLAYLRLLLAVQLLYAAATAPILFDRHLLSPAATALALLAASACEISARRLWLCALLQAPFAWYGIAGSHDMHALHRALFRAARQVEDAGVDPLDVNAGYAHDGWQGFHRRTVPFEPEPMNKFWEPEHEFWRGVPADDRIAENTIAFPYNVWWAKAIRARPDAEFVVALVADGPDAADARTRRARGTEVARSRVRMWLSWTEQSVVVYRRPR